jgi:hypothetical protein
MIHLTLNFKKNAKNCFLKHFYIEKLNFVSKNKKNFSFFSENGPVTKNAKECKGSNIIFLLGICVTFNRKKIWLTQNQSLGEINGYIEGCFIENHTI